MTNSTLHNEKALLQQASGGDEAAFGRLFKHYFDHLYGFALTVSKSPSIAEEIVQDAFVNVWMKREQLASVEKFDAWLFIIVRNQAYNTIRKKVQEPAFVDELEAYFALSADSPEQQLLYKESQELLARAATTLPPQQQLVFSMSRFDGLTLDEIAEKLQLSKNTVKVHLTKALHAVRLYLQEHAPDLLLIYCLFEGLL